MDVPITGDTEKVEFADFTPQIGLMIGLQGLNRICDFVTFSELKLIRLVCQIWNNVITNHPRFHNAHLKIGLGWELNCNSFQLNSMSKWKTVTFHRFALHFGSNRMFTKYWYQAAERVKVLNLEYMKVSCQDLGIVINNCLVLESITFIQIHFSTILIFPPHENNQVVREAFNRTQFLDNRNDPSGSICCQHDEFTPTGIIGPSTIKSILISKQFPFPLCILDLLAKRSHGKLETFKFESYIDLGNNHVHETHPNTVQIQSYLQRIYQGSNQTLKDFVWINTGTIRNITQIFAQPNFQPALEKLSIIQKSESNADRGRIRHNLEWVTFTIFLSQQFGLTELNISIVDLTLTFRQAMQNILPNMPTLQKLKIKFNTIEHNARDVEIFLNAVNLNELEIIEKTPRRNRRFHNRNNSLNCNYLIRLPLTIRKLTLDHQIRTLHLATCIKHPSFILISKLKIIEGNAVNDQIAQLIIIRLTQLEELTIKNSKVLTDAGLTGLDPNACKQLINCHSQALLFKDPHVTNQIRRTLTELIYLRELDLTGCTRLSDISACYAIRFPELKKLTLSGCNNVSDIGLISLGKHNPKLETFIFRGNRKISHFGLNRLVENCKTLRSVQTTKLAGNRLVAYSGVLQYTPSLHFKDVVSFTPTHLKIKN